MEKKKESHFCINCRYIKTFFFGNDPECKHPIFKITDYVTGIVTYKNRSCKLQNEDGLCRQYEEGSSKKSSKLSGWLSHVCSTGGELSVTKES